MRSARFLLSMVLAAAGAGIIAPVRAAEPPPDPARATASSDGINASITAIRQAPDPSIAIQAYADARAAAPDDVSVERAYVERMVDFGLPEMADTQARDLMRQRPEDGLGWAVAAYMAAKREQDATAITEIAQAVKLSPGNTFVLRTAGQIVAWYDTRADKSRLTATERSAVERVAGQLAGDAAYVDAYRRATETYRQATQAAPPPQSSYYPSTDYDSGTYAPQLYQPPPPAYSPYGDYYSDVYYQPTYPNPYYGLIYPGYASWWPAPCSVGFWWWPTCFSTAVIFDRGFYREHPNFLRRDFHEGSRDGFRREALTSSRGRSNEFSRSSPGASIGSSIGSVRGRSEVTRSSSAAQLGSRSTTSSRATAPRISTPRQLSAPTAPRSAPSVARSSVSRGFSGTVRSSARIGGTVRAGRR